VDGWDFKMKIFISGICGFVGSTLAKAFKELDSSCEVYGCDSFIRSGSFINRPILERLGIKVFYADQRQWSDIEVMPSPDWIVDCAANPSVLAGVDGSTSSRQLCDHNLIGTINLLEFAKARKAGFILISTSRVYSIAELTRFPVVASSTAYKADAKGNFPVGSSAAGIAEGFSTQPPISIYGASKLACEILALEYAASFDFPVWINRCGVLAGAGQFGKPDQGIFAFWINSYIQKRNLRYTGFNGTGLQVRDCLHPNDLARLALQQMRLRAAADKSSVINVSGGVENSMSLKELSDWLAPRYGERAVAADSNTRLFDVPWLVLDSSLAQKEWGWRPEISIEKILQEICVHAEANPNWLEMTH
jgi:CDP-paratose 2-epimerase